MGSINLKTGGAGEETGNVHGRAGRPRSKKGGGVIKTELLDILACPRCKGGLDYRPEENELRCLACRLVYAVRGDIPVLLVDEARAFE